ncbi:MAG: phosphoribosylformylglycinamidine cyclo-ligase [Actinomycetota bacterium]
MTAGAYRRAGVDLDAAAEATMLIRDLARGASHPGVVEGVGGFAGLFRLDGDLLLAAATDGVGTKLEVARLAARYDTVGIDLVAMCANDVICTGARPLFFLDYLAVARLVPQEAAGIVAGVAEGCRRAGCALLGGETAEHPGVMEEGRFDLAGFCVGLVEESALLGPSRVEVGDAVVGLRSSGLHSNGYSLVRKAIEGLDLAAIPEGLDRPLADELLEPTVIYVDAVLEATRRGLVRSAAHITGGGILENLPRALPEGLGAEVDSGKWQVPPIFDLVGRMTEASRQEMFSTFNMGIGMALVVSSGDVEDTVALAGENGIEAMQIGAVTKGGGVTLL